MKPKNKRIVARRILFQKRSDCLNREFQQVWKDFCLLSSSIQDFRSVGRTGWVIFQRKDGSKLVSSEDLGQRAGSYFDKLPEEIIDAIKEWIRAAWTCHDDLKDDRLFAHYLKKAGLKGRLILAQETVEDKASNLGESIGDVVEDVPK